MITAAMVQILSGDKKVIPFTTNLMNLNSLTIDCDSLLCCSTDSLNCSFHATNQSTSDMSLCDS